MAEEETERLFTVREVANYFHVSEETIRRWIKGGHIQYVQVGPFRLKRLHPAAVIKGAKDGQQGSSSTSTEGTKTAGAGGNSIGAGRAEANQKK